MVGNDGFGEFLTETLKHEGVDTSYIKSSDKYVTSLAFVSFKDGGEREFSFYRKAAADLYFTADDFSSVFGAATCSNSAVLRLKPKRRKARINIL